MNKKLVSMKPSELVIMAIHNLRHESGSSEKEIIQFISEQYGINEDYVAPHVEAALKRGVTFGILVESGGRYELGGVPEPPAKETNRSDTSKNRRKKKDVRESKQKADEVDEAKKGISMAGIINRRHTLKEISRAIEKEIVEWKKSRAFEGGMMGAMPGDLTAESQETEKASTQRKRRKPPEADHRKRKCPKICPKSCPKSIEKKKRISNYGKHRRVRLR